MRNVAVIALLSVTLVLAVASGKSDEEAQKKVSSQAAAETLSADELHDIYAKNEVAADQRFKNKVIAITGPVQGITTGITDEPIVSLGKILGGAQCSFAKSQADSVAKLVKGQDVKLKGLVSGRTLGSPMLKGCVIE